VSEDQVDRWEGQERDALYALVPGDDQDYMSIWSLDDLGREIDYFDPMAVLRPLITAGLAHEPAKGYVCASRAGVKAVAMIGKVV
jgi:hypothetical protein